MRKRQKFLWEFTSDYEKTEASACVNVNVNVYVYVYVNVY